MSSSRSASRKNPATCPVIQQAEAVCASARSLKQAVRKLRASLSLCRACESAPSCLIIQDFNRQIDLALLAVCQERNLQV
jgi:hypothetical protein